MIGIRRPTEVTLLIAIVVFGSVSPIIGGFAFLTGVFSVEPYFLSLSVVGEIYILIGLVGLTVAYGLWKKVRWVWTATFVVCVLAFLFGVLALPTGLVGVIINAIELYLLTRSRVKEYLGAS
jgi:hypothetical protein